MSYFESEDRHHADRVRGWLDRNKIFFETVAALLLSVMAISVSILQMCTSDRQTDLIDKQTIIADDQLKYGRLADSLQIELLTKQTLLMQEQTTLAQSAATIETQKDSIAQIRSKTELVRIVGQIADLYPAGGSRDLQRWNVAELLQLTKAVRDLIEQSEGNLYLLTHPVLLNNWIDARVEIQLVQRILTELNPYPRLTYLNTCRSILVRVWERVINTGMNIGWFKNADRSSLDSVVRRTNKIFLPAEP